MTQNGPGTMTPHNAMAHQRGRLNAHKRLTGILGVSPGGNLYC